MGDERVKIVEICRVAPLLPSSPCAPKFLPLTFFDIILLPFPPTSRLYFYHNPNSHNLLPNLKHSLSIILSDFLPLAGNLIWPQHSPKPFIQFVEGDAVPFTIVESDLDFHHLSGHSFRQAAEFQLLVPQLCAAEDRAAAIALQLTLFPNKGLSIGITTHHAVVDGNTSTSFIKSWAQVCKLNITQPSPMPFYDRTYVIDSTAHLEPIHSNRTLNLPPLFVTQTQRDLFRFTLEMTPQNLQKLKQWVLKQNQQRRSFHLSSFALTLAYLLLCTAKSEGLRDGKLNCLFPVDARSRLHPPLPSSYFGNCLVSRGVSLERNELLSDNGMMVAIEEISKAIQSLEGGVLESLKKKQGSQNTENSLTQQTYLVGGSPKFEVYNADFGWGKPVKVEFVTMERVLFPFFDTKNGDGGIEIGMVGKINELERFATLFTQGLEAL